MSLGSNRKINCSQKVPSLTNAGITFVLHKLTLDDAANQLRFETLQVEAINLTIPN